MSRFFITVLTLFIINSVFSQTNVEKIKSTNNRDFKIYKSNSGTELIFEFCNQKNESNCEMQLLLFDLRGIVKLLQKNLSPGIVNVPENGKIIVSNNNTISLATLKGIISDPINKDTLLRSVRKTFFND